MFNPYIWSHMGYGYLMVVRQHDFEDGRIKHDEKENTRGVWADHMVARKIFNDLLTMTTVGEA